MRKLICFAVPVLFLACVFAMPGGEFWEKKEYSQWSQKECAKLLEDSPWAKPFTLSSVAILKKTSADATDSDQPYIKYHVQFRSAKPVRQAVVRQTQIAQKYDSLLPEQKQTFDKRAESFISSDFSKAVILYVTYESNNRDSDRELARYWQSQTVDLLKNSVYLIGTKGHKIPLSQYMADQGGERSFQFVFPREVDGKPIIDPLNDKTLKLEFAYPVIASMGDGRAYMEFKLEKMIFEGNVAY